ncbi:MAG: hypothetical protein ACON3Z_18455 [Bradymonadia bacterium]
MIHRVVGSLCLLGLFACGQSATTKRSQKADATKKPAASQPSETWAIAYVDGVGNQYEFTRADGRVHFRYTPVTPEMSSSGTYSGGSPKRGVLTPDQAKALVAQATKWHEATGEHVKRRSKGVSSFRVAIGQIQSRFLIPEHRLGKLTQILTAIRN